MILNATNSSSLSHLPDITDMINNNISHNSAASSLPISHGTVTPAGLHVDHPSTMSATGNE